MKTKINETGGATPRPLYALPLRSDEQLSGYARILESDGSIFLSLEAKVSNKKAALIVQSVNQFDALNAVEEAAKRLVNAVQWPTPTKNLHEIKDDCRAALAQLSALKESK